jgi:hypothetical protein
MQGSIQILVACLLWKALVEGLGGGWLGSGVGEGEIHKVASKFCVVVTCLFVGKIGGGGDGYHLVAQGNC